MPTYIYECQHHTPPLRKYVVRSMTDSEKVEKCVQCDKTLVRVYDAPAVTFMGGGWGKDAR